MPGKSESCLLFLASMRTLPFSDEAVNEALAVIRGGGVIAHATETCYGFACDLSNPQAVQKLFTIKQRPLHQPVSGLFASVEDAKQFVVWNDKAEELAQQYLPGPLTMILPMNVEAPRMLYPSLLPHPLTPSPDGGRGTSFNDDREYKRKKPVNRKVLYHAREMRKEPTEAEKVLWDALRFDQLDTRFRRQHPIEGMILDFYCHDAHLAVEVDGTVHNNPEQRERDDDRTQELLYGHDIHVMRFSNDEVMNHLQDVMKKIKEALPSPAGGRDRGMGEETARTLGVRVSPHPHAHSLVSLFGSPLSTTSSNVHGQPNPYSAEEIEKQFANADMKPDLILDSGTLPPTPPSTVIDLANEGGALRTGSLKIS